VVRPSATSTPSVAAPAATPTPTETEILKETATATATASQAENAPELPPKFTGAMADSLLLRKADVPGFVVRSTFDYGPQDAQGLKEWFGSAQSAQPFIDEGLLRIAMSAYDSSAPCNTVKVCWIVSSAMIYSSTTGASQAPSLLSIFEQSHDKTLRLLTVDQILALGKTGVISPTINLVGTTGTSGIGKYAQTTVSFYGVESNAVVILQAGGDVPGAMATGDAYYLWKIMNDLATSH
jgi:hypothetical protein